MRAHAWADTPLGDPAQWPTSLAAACRICLTSSFPMVVWWGEDLYFLYNDAYLPFLGAKHPVLAKPGNQVWDEIWDIIGPALRSVLASGTATWSQDVMLPLNRNGYTEETYWTYSFSPLYDEAGTVRGAHTEATDTTERVIGARRLAVLNELGALAGRARSVTEACDLITLALSRAEDDVPFAAAFLREEEAGLVLSVVSPPGTDPDALRRGAAHWPVDEAMRTGRLVRVSDVRERFGDLPAGSWASPPASAVVLPLTGEAGGPAIGAVVLAASAGRALDESYESFLTLVARQIASAINSAVAYQIQQRRAEELTELDRAKTVFFANISHEFRTPLTLIMGPLAELRARLGEQDPAVRGDLDLIQRNGLRLGKLVNTLLDFSRIEAGRIEARVEPLDLAAVTADLASVFRSAIERAGLAYEVECAPLPAPVDLDREMWEKVILNLLSNALKFTFDGTISVRVRQEAGQAVVEVADTGCGVPADELPRLFERFRRIASSRSRSTEGSGIGLALVRELVTLNGGTITAASEEGAGTVFTIRLPLGRDHAQAPGRGGITRAADPYVAEVLGWLPGNPSAAGDPVLPAGRDRAGPRGSAGPVTARVLIADDNADMREYLRRLLETSYQVTTAADGDAALTAARSDPPDLVVADVMMPGLDGFGLVTALRADPRTAQVPVLLLSARAGPEAAVAGLDAGADDYLIKPFSAADLLARVRGNLQLASMRSHHARWRAALINSLQDAFFVMDDAGAVIEINDAFTKVLGFGVAGLPYCPPYPWRPASDAPPEARHRTDESFAQLMAQGRGKVVAPVIHRDGHLLWASATFSEIHDRETGRRLVVGTLRDVTTEHYAGQREAALAAMGILLSRADSVDDAVGGAIRELQQLWRARRVLAVSWSDPDLASAAPASSVSSSTVSSEHGPGGDVAGPAVRRAGCDRRPA